MRTPPSISAIALMQASALTPSMFMAHEPHTPSRQERRKVNVVSISFLILIKASRTIGPQSLRSIAKVSTTGFFPSPGFQRYTLNSRTRAAQGGPGPVLPTPIFEFAGRVNSAIADPQSHAPHPSPLPASGEREGPAKREGEGQLGRGFIQGFSTQYTRALGGKVCTSFDRVKRWTGR